MIDLRLVVRRSHASLMLLRSYQFLPRLVVAQHAIVALRVLFEDAALLGAREVLLRIDRRMVLEMTIG